MWLTRLILTNKRLFRTYSFLVLLIMIPLTAGALSFVSTSEKGVVTIAVAADGISEKNEKQSIDNVINRLKEQTSIIRFLEMDSPEAAIDAAARGQADAAWIFTADYDKNLSEVASGNRRVIAEVYTKEDTVFMKLAREKLFAAVYPDLSVQIFRRFISGTMGDIAEEDMEHYYSIQASDGQLVEFSFADNIYQSKDAVKGDYLLFPVRGLLAILIFAAGMAGAVFYTQDQRNGCFTWLSRAGRQGMTILYIGCSVFWTSAVSLAALFLTKSAVSAGHEIFLMFLYGTAVTALCSLLRRVFRKAEYLAVFLPVAVLLVLGLCPVFLNFKTFRSLSELLPAFHYLHAAGSTFYVRSLALTAGAYLLLDTAAALLSVFRKRPLFPSIRKI